MRATIVDVGYGAAQDGLFTSTYAQPVSRVRWEITENTLNARLSYERIAGTDGKGNQAIGAPNLSDKVWLHGWGEDAVMAMVNNGKTNVMPSFAKRLTPEQIHVLAAYVWNLSQSTAVATK